MKKNSINPIITLMFTVFCFALQGCSYQSKTKTDSYNKGKNTNLDRVVEQDLSPKEKWPRKIHFADNLGKVQKNTIRKIKKTTVQPTQVIQHIYQINFENDSIKLNPSIIDANLPEIKRLTDKHNMDINVVGHSHGISKLGTRYLASKRANQVYNYLVKKGFNRRAVKRRASWGGFNQKGIIQKGVEIVLTIQPKTGKNRVKKIVKTGGLAYGG